MKIYGLAVLGLLAFLSAGDQVLTSAEAESGTLIGGASVVVDGSASGGQCLRIAGAGAGSEYGSIAVTPGDYVVAVTYRAAEAAALQVQIMPGGGSVVLSLTPTNGGWETRVTTVVTVTTTTTNLVMIGGGGGIVDLDTLDMCVSSVCGGCEVIVWEEDGDDGGVNFPPPLMNPGDVPSGVFFSPGNPYEPAGPSSGSIAGTKWSVSASIPIGAAADWNEVIFFEISNLVIEADPGECEFACMLGCAGASGCSGFVSMTMDVNECPSANQDFLWIHDSTGTRKKKKGDDNVPVVSGASSPCGTSVKTEVGVYLSYDKEHRILYPVGQFKFTCYQCDGGV